MNTKNTISKKQENRFIIIFIIIALACCFASCSGAREACAGNKGMLRGNPAGITKFRA